MCYTISTLHVCVEELLVLFFQILKWIYHNSFIIWLKMISFYILHLIRSVYGNKYGSLKIDGCSLYKITLINYLLQLKPLVPLRVCIYLSAPWENVPDKAMKRFFFLIWCRRLYKTFSMTNIYWALICIRYLLGSGEWNLAPQLCVVELSDMQINNVKCTLQKYV